MTNPVKRMQSAVLATVGAVASVFGLGRKVQADLMGIKLPDKKDEKPPELKQERNAEKRLKKAKSWNRTNAWIFRGKPDENSSQLRKSAYRRHRRAEKKLENNRRTEAGLRRAEECAHEYEMSRREDPTFTSKWKFEDFRREWNFNRPLASYITA
jgi:hypothetical protein